MGKGEQTRITRQGSQQAVETNLEVTQDESQQTQQHGDQQGTILKEIRDLKEEFSSKLSLLETNLIAQINGTIEKAIQSVRSEFNDRINGLEQRILSMEKHVEQHLKSCQNKDNSNPNVLVISNLPFTNNENIKCKVEGLIKDTLKVKDVEVSKVERKDSFSPDKPGVVIVSCNNPDDRNKVLKVKSRLKDSKRYKRVFIDADKSRQQRQYEANLRMLVNTMAKDSLMVRGSRVIQKPEQNRGQQDNNNPEIRR